MPSPRRTSRNQRLGIVRATLVFSAAVTGLLGLADKASAQITSVTASDGRRMFVNADPPVLMKLTPPKPPASIYLPGEISFPGQGRLSLSIDLSTPARRLG